MFALRLRLLLRHQRKLFISFNVELAPALLKFATSHLVTVVVESVSGFLQILMSSIQSLISS